MEKGGAEEGCFITRFLNMTKEKVLCLLLLVSVPFPSAAVLWYRHILKKKILPKLMCPPLECEYSKRFV
jgi:hypothetical protein